MKSPKDRWVGKSRKRLFLLLIILICFTSVTLILVNTDLTETTTSKVKESIKEIEEPSIKVEEIIPNELTEFFSKEQGKALLYYTIVNDSVRFFKTKGIDPVTGQKLLPVTQEIINKYQERIQPKKELAVTDTKTYKVNEVKILKKKEKPIVKKEPKRESIWNTELLNSSSEDEISLFVFNENDQIDIELTNRLKSEFAKKNYFVTDEIIYTDEINNEIAGRLKTSDVKYFEGNLKKYTDYICIGIVSYSYDQNAYRNDFIDCTLKIDYFIYDAESGQEMFTEKDKLIGSAQTKKKAKKEAIDKFIL